MSAFSEFCLFIYLLNRSVIPEESLLESGLHDGVVVLDPYPLSNYGHLVIVFFIDIRVSKYTCHEQGGIYLGKILYKFTAIVSFIITFFLKV